LAELKQTADHAWLRTRARRAVPHCDRSVHSHKTATISQAPSFFDAAVLYLLQNVGAV
jgi:hypothetical protein